MKSFRDLCLFLVGAVVLFWGLSLANSSLPDRVEYSNTSINPNASTAARLVVRAALATGAAPQKINDYLVFRTAQVQLGGREVTFVALPGTKWFAL